MQYDLIGGYAYHGGNYSRWSLRDLIDVLEIHKEMQVKFLGTDYTITDLYSWRGSYSVPAIEYGNSDKTAGEIAKMLRERLKETHYGYKGGEYFYHISDIFYIVGDPSYSSEYTVIDFEIVGGTIILKTKIVEW